VITVRLQLVHSNSAANGTPFCLICNQSDSAGMASSRWKGDQG
jgi:hypothetical protein